VARQVRGRRGASALPFGGVQLVLTGDFLQLPPVVKRRDGGAASAGPLYAFQSTSWRRAIKHQLLLRTVHRQKESKFVELLAEVCLSPPRTSISAFDSHADNPLLDCIVASWCV
jgi:ATP-dependent DNA helicase PIF1